MLAGAAAYVAFYPALEPIIKSLAVWGKITLPDATSPWPWVVGLVLVIVVALFAVQHRADAGTGAPII